MPLTKLDNEHEQFVSMFQQLVDEREMLARENEYLKAKMNQSVLMETIKEMKRERDLLLKLLSNLTSNHQDEQSGFAKQRNHAHSLAMSSNPVLNKTSSTLSRPTSTTTTNPSRIHRFKPLTERSIPVSYPAENGSSPSIASTSYAKPPASNNKKMFVCPAPPPSSSSSIYTSNRIIRKHDIQLKHSPNSPFQHYRSQSLQDLT